MTSTKSIKKLGNSTTAWTILKSRNGQIKKWKSAIKNAIILKVASTKSNKTLGIRLQHEGLAWNGQIKKWKSGIKKRWFWKLASSKSIKNLGNSTTAWRTRMERSNKNENLRLKTRWFRKWQVQKSINNFWEFDYSMKDSHDTVK